MQISMPPARPPAGIERPGLGTPWPGGPSRRRRRRQRAAPPPPGLCRVAARYGTVPTPPHGGLHLARPKDSRGELARGLGARVAPPPLRPSGSWAGPGRPRPTRKRGQTGGSELGFGVAHLPGLPSRGASAWPSRPRARRPSERGARGARGAQPWRAEGGAPGVDLGSEPPLRGSREAEGPEAAETATGSGSGGGAVTSAPELRPAWSELSPAHVPPRASRETEAGAGCAEARVGAESEEQPMADAGSGTNGAPGGWGRGLRTAVPCQGG